jgi:WD40 repeat protein
MNNPFTHTSVGHTKATGQPDRRRPIVAFLSYSRASDTAFQQALTHALGEHGIEVRGDWLLTPGPDYRAQLGTLIREAYVFLAVLSRLSVVSPACREEIDQAHAQKKKLLPILREDDLDKAQLHEAIQRPQWTLLRSVDDWDRGIQRLREAITTDFELMATHTWLTQRAMSWEEKGQPASALLRGRDFGEVESWQPRIMANQLELPNITPLQSTFINASQRARTQRARRISGLALVVMALLLWLYVQAEQRRKEAVVLQQQAEARGLAAASDARREEEPQLSLLLAVEALRSGPPDQPPEAEAEQSLRRVLAGMAASQALPGSERALTLALSKDGKTLFTTHADAKARLWALDQPSAQPSIFTLAESIGQARAFALSPPRTDTAGNQTRYVIGTGDNARACIWEVGSKAPPTVFQLPFKVDELVFAPSGRWLAVRGNGGELELWDAAKLPARSAIALESAPRPPSVISSYLQPNLFFSRRGRWLARLQAEGIAVWDLQASQLGAVPAATHHINPSPNSVAFSRDESFLTFSTAKTIATWDFRHAPEPLPESLTGARRVAMSPDHDWIAAVAPTEGIPAVRLWQRSSSENSWKIAGLLHEAGVIPQDLAFARGLQLVATSRDKTVRVWNLRDSDGEVTSEVLRGQDAAFDDKLNLLAVSDDGSRIVTGMANAISGPSEKDLAVRVWERAPDGVRRGLSPVRFHFEEDDNTSLAFSGNGTLAVSISKGHLSAWDLSDLSKPRRAALPKEMVGNKVVLSHTGRLLAVISGYTVRVFERERAAADDISHWTQALSQLVGAESEEYGPQQAVFSSDDHWLVVSGPSGTWAWDLTTKKRHDLSNRSNSGAVAFQTNGRDLLTYDDDKGVRRWPFPLRDGAAPTSLATVGASVESIALHPIASWLAVGEPLFRLYKLDALRGRTVYLRGERERSEDHVLFTPDGSRLVTGGKGVRLWNFGERGPTGGAVQLLPEVDRVIPTCTDNGRWLITAHAGVAQFWPLHLRELCAIAERAAGRNLTLDEWRRFFPRADPPMAYRPTYLSLPRPLYSEAYDDIARNLTPAEWKRYFPGVPYQPTFPSRPVPER